MIEEAKASFLGAKGRLEHAFSHVPDDRINWSPSPTARTPVHLVAHSAWAIRSLNETLDGRRYATPTTAEADREFRDWERQWSTREGVLELLERNSADYLAWLDSLDPSRLDSIVTLPFALGTAPLSVALTFVPAHTHSHAAQIDYIQTIYGDHDWHISM